MPKYGIHHIVVKDALNQLAVSQDPNAVGAAQILQAELPSAIIGSVGPDLFFWGPDYEIVDKLYRLYQNISDVVEVYNRIVEPIRQVGDAVGDVTEALVGTLAPNTIELIKHLIDEVKETAALFKTAVGTNLFSGVIQGVDLLTNAAGLGSLSHQFFQQFVPDVHNNDLENEWYWFDMLHYRYTGQFSANLIEAAANDRQKAFAYGYMSHIAADVVGHPYVNVIVGSPYRLNVQRHVTAENFQDVWKYNRYYGGESINQTLLARMGLPENLPTDIGDQLNLAFRATYDHLEAARRPGRLGGNGFYTRAQIDDTYDVFYKILEMMQDMAVERPTEPFSGVMDILAGALDAFSPPPEPEEPSSACSLKDIFSAGFTEKSRECYKNFFEEVADWLSYLGELLVWTIESIFNLIDLLLTTLLSLPIMVLLAILYGIQLLCYQAYRSARMALSTSGFVLPEPDELNTSIGQNLITLGYACADNFKNFPSLGTPATSHLVCPTPYTESPKTAAAFHAREIEATPDIYIQEAPFDEDVLRMYAAAEAPHQTRSLESDRHVIGNAVDFTAWMIRLAQDVNRPDDILPVLFADWNLDSDRGYGYHMWRGTVPHSEPYEVDDETYLIE